jgi:hypothetical protein
VETRAEYHGPKEQKKAQGRKEHGVFWKESMEWLEESVLGRMRLASDGIQISITHGNH